MQYSCPYQQSVCVRICRLTVLLLDDYGTLTMARTLGSDPNQVAKNGRRVLVGWIGGTPASQSLSRDLSLSENYELLQQFVPEYQTLRQSGTFEQTTTQETSAAEIVHSAGSLQMEVVATFTFTANPKAPLGVSILGGTAEAMVDCSNTTITNKGEAPSVSRSVSHGLRLFLSELSGAAFSLGAQGCMVAVADKPSAGSKKSSGGPVLPVGAKTVTMHMIVDHEIVETIVNNRTAMVTYHTALPSAASTAVTIFGAGPGSGVTGTVTTWSLSSANNARGQP